MAKHVTTITLKAAFFFHSSNVREHVPPWPNLTRNFTLPLGSTPSCRIAPVQKSLYCDVSDPRVRRLDCRRNWAASILPIFDFSHFPKPPFVFSPFSPLEPPGEKTYLVLRVRRNFMGRKNPETPHLLITIFSMPFAVLPVYRAKFTNHCSPLRDNSDQCSSLDTILSAPCPLSFPPYNDNWLIFRPF